MTREEQIRHEAGSLADFAIAHGAPWKEYHNGFIDGAKWADEHPVQPPLPSNLDEAARYYEEHRGQALDSDNKECRRAFKAGAEWMAGQGLTMEITDDTEWADLDSFVHKNVTGGSIIQIRKK